jgi:hypothetical protein
VGEGAHTKKPRKYSWSPFVVPMNLTLAKPNIRRSTNQRNMKATLGHGSALASKLGRGWAAGKNKVMKPASCSIVSHGKIKEAGSSDSHSSQANTWA